MTPSSTLLLEKVTGRTGSSNPFGELAPCTMEQALLRARIALDAGWQLTPDEILVYAGHDEVALQGGRVTVLTPETEDEIEAIPDYFGDEAS